MWTINSLFKKFRRHRRALPGFIAGSLFVLFLIQRPWISTQKARFIDVGVNNLVEDGQHIKVVECTRENMNAQRLEQDHPCVIDIIRKHYLHPPTSRKLPYNLNSSSPDPSEGQSNFILNRLLYPDEGFFIEANANDGENLSNTLYMEWMLDWTGLLIEPDPILYSNLMNKNRKAWTLPVCLSPVPYPITMKFYALPKQVDRDPEKDVWPRQNAYSIHRNITDGIRINNRIDEITVQCFPLYSILLAVNRTQVDYFGLAIEGNELRVLKTIPWTKVDIKTFAVEFAEYEESDDVNDDISKMIDDSANEKRIMRYMTKEVDYFMFNRFNYGHNDLLFISSKHAHNDDRISNVSNKENQFNIT